VSLLDPAVVRPLIIVLLFLVLMYTLVRREIGEVHSLQWSARQRTHIGLVTGAVLGFYDGFFGPGTGSFLIFVFVAVLGFDFIHASASAKIVNLATNAASLAYFIPTGNVRYELAVVMAIANMSGSSIGARVAMRKGASFVRCVFVVIVLALLTRLLWLPPKAEQNPLPVTKADLGLLPDFGNLKKNPSSITASTPAGFRGSKHGK
jgi:uncharacterized membrane protein YfcA